MLRYKEKRWHSKKLISSGGMPSSHSATVMALAVAIGLQEGTGGSTFAIAIVFACVVMYDATGVRLHAGRQAELANIDEYSKRKEHEVRCSNLISVLHMWFLSLSLSLSLVVVGAIAELLNQIICEFPPEHPLSSSRPLRDSLGHTPVQFCTGSCWCNAGLCGGVSDKEIQLGCGVTNSKWPLKICSDILPTKIIRYRTVVK